MIVIDGSQGEGGGQVLRTSLSLSMITGQPFRIENIRANRDKPGLMRQHLTCVKAAQEISGAVVAGGVLGSRDVTFEPAPVVPGAYTFAVGTAGSAMLVMQTLLLPLVLSGGASRLVVEGGTNNSKSPPFEFIERSYLPALSRMGIRVGAELQRRGFFPAGGGRACFEIDPCARCEPAQFLERGPEGDHVIEAFIARLPIDIAKRELGFAGKRLDFPDDALKIREDKNSPGPGNCLSITLNYEQVTEVFTGFGELGVSSEQVAKRACKPAAAYLKSSAAVGPSLADQILLPMAVAGSGTFTTLRLSRHTETNIKVIETFLPVKIDRQDVGDGVWQMTVRR